MQYIVYKRFKTNALCGDVNLPAMTLCEENNGVVYYQGKPLCYIVSENAHKHFAKNDDGNGMLRGQLIQAICKTLQAHQERWEKVWSDNVCQLYKRTEHKEHWLWNHDFYNANIDDLKHIANLVGAKY